MNDKHVLIFGSDALMQRQFSPAAIARTQFLLSRVDKGVHGADGVDFLRKLGMQGGDPGRIITLCDAPNRSRISDAKTVGANALIQRSPNSEEAGQAIARVLSHPPHAGTESPVERSSGRLHEEIARWTSPKMQEVWETIEQAARLDVPVLIRGETGTGKDLVARAIHERSRRQGQPFVKVSCAAGARELLGSEMFGEKWGASIRRQQLRTGKFDAADQGSILLDEIGDLPPALQAKLLRFLRDGEFSRVGGRSTARVDVRVIAATKHDLEGAVRVGRFREDLHHRLNVIQIVVPPLRDRPEDIPMLVKYFIERYAKESHRDGFMPSPDVMAQLVHHRYPGNVLELESIVKRMIILNDPLLPESLASRGKAEDTQNGPSGPVEVRTRSLKEIGREAARAAEREVMAEVLQETGWNRVRASRLLNISYRALLYKMKEGGLGHGPGARTGRREVKVR